MLSFIFGVVVGILIVVAFVVWFLKNPPNFLPW